MTRSMKDILDQLKQVNGAPICRIYSPDNKKFILISKQDYGQVIAPFLTKGSVFSLLNGVKYPQGVSINLEREEALDTQDPEFLRKLVQIKWRLGFIDYSSNEMLALKEWLKDLSPIQMKDLRDWTLKSGNPRQMKLFKSL